MALSTDPGQMLYRRSAQRATWLALLVFLLIFLYLRNGFPRELVASVSSMIDTPTTASESQPASNPATEQPVAVIIETHGTANMIPLMLHFSSVLGPRWKTILFTLEEHWQMPASAPFGRAVDTGAIEIRFLPPETTMFDSMSVSIFLTSPWLWEQVEQAERVLLFQTDSVLCANAEATADDFLAFDYVGAPIAEVYGHGYNGGLSIRNPRLFLDVVRTANFGNSSEYYEDQWFYKELRARGDAHLPTEEEASRFAVETIFYETPLGYHQPQRWQEERLAEIEDYCPEVRLLIGRRAA